MKVRVACVINYSGDTIISWSRSSPLCNKSKNHSPGYRRQYINHGIMRVIPQSREILIGSSSSRVFLLSHCPEWWEEIADFIILIICVWHIVLCIPLQQLRSALHPTHTEFTYHHSGFMFNVGYSYDVLMVLVHVYECEVNAGICSSGKTTTSTAADSKSRAKPKQSGINWTSQSASQPVQPTNRIYSQTVSTVVYLNMRLFVLFSMQCNSTRNSSFIIPTQLQCIFILKYCSLFYYSVYFNSDIYSNIHHNTYSAQLSQSVSQYMSVWMVMIVYGMLMLLCFFNIPRFSHTYMYVYGNTTVNSTPAIAIPALLSLHCYFPTIYHTIRQLKFENLSWFFCIHTSLFL